MEKYFPSSLLFSFSSFVFFISDFPKILKNTNKTKKYSDPGYSDEEFSWVSLNSQETAYLT